jgi:hypothetical protein
LRAVPSGIRRKRNLRIELMEERWVKSAPKGLVFKQLLGKKDAQCLPEGCYPSWVAMSLALGMSDRTEPERLKGPAATVSS